MTRTPSSELPYRAGVGMMVLNRENKVLIAKRLRPSEKTAWQMPQGGIDPGETPENAALRELEEEIGTNHVEIIAETNQWYFYDLPPHLVGRLWNGDYRGQKQKWFLMRFLGDDGEINLETHHPEFSDWRWIPIEDLLSYVVSFKRNTYEKVIREFKGILLKTY